MRAFGLCGVVLMSLLPGIAGAGAAGNTVVQPAGLKLQEAVNGAHGEMAAAWAGTWLSDNDAVIILRYDNGILDGVSRDERTVLSFICIVDDAPARNVAHCTGDGMSQADATRFVYSSTLSLGDGKTMMENWKAQGWLASGKEKQTQQGELTYKKKEAGTR